MRPQFKQLMDECGFYISHLNPEATDRELEFLLEQVVLETLKIVRFYQEANQENDSWVYCLEMMQDHIKARFGLHQ